MNGMDKDIYREIMEAIAEDISLIMMDSAMKLFCISNESNIPFDIILDTYVETMQKSSSMIKEAVISLVNDHE